ncbi:carbohydrate-binding protein [Agaribacterium sp. ZY112]|uniref:carbohydrate-binding protein n=1 Tax=Agaribacterium sp. ZY112 TaxID=3233574 RepID=UPI0035267E4E
MKSKLPLIPLLACLISPAASFALDYNDNSSFTLVNADNGGQVRLRDAPGGRGDINAIRGLANKAGLPSVVRDSRLSTGDYASNIAQLAAVQNTLSSLADARPDTYTGAGTVVTNSNLDQHRNAIANSGGTFIFRGTINISSKDKLIQVGENTTIWVDGTVRYTGPVIPGTIPDEYSVSDVINGIFEVRGTNNRAKNNTKILGTKRGQILGNDRLSAVYVRYAKNLLVEGLNTNNCRNVLFLNNVYGDSLAQGNFIYNSTRRAIHVKASNGITVKNNLVYDADVDGIDIDAYTKNSKTIENVLIDSGTRWMVWTEIASVDNLIDGNVGIHVNNGDGGFQENGSESNGQPATARNTWKNNHIFYVDSGSNWKQGFSFHPNRVIDRDSVVFDNNYVWQTNHNAYKRNPKNNTTNDVSYYHYVGADPILPSPSPSPTTAPDPEQSAYQSLTIPGLIQAEDFDLGGQNIAYSDSTNGNAGNEYRSSSRVDIQTSSDGGYNVGWIANNEWLEYTLAAVTSGTYNIKLRIAAQGNSGGKSVDIKLDGQTLGNISFEGTGGWQNWKTVSLDNVTLSGGVNKVLRLEMNGGGFNINWIEFEASNNQPINAEFSLEAEAFNNTGGSYGGFETYSANGIEAINFNQRGDWADYKVNVAQAGNYRFEAWLGTTQEGTAIEVLVDGTSYLRELVPNNGSWDNFVKLSPNALIPISAGQHTIRIISSGSSSSTWEWNADRFNFIQE